MKESKDVSGASLNTCRLIEKSGVTYSMSLLALCGFHGRKDMVDLLLEEGAGNRRHTVTFSFVLYKVMGTDRYFIACSV